MRKVFLVVGAALLLGTSQVSAWEGQVIISTPNTSLVLHANEGEDLRQDYYGGPIAEINQLKEAGSDFNFAALPTFGTIDMIHLPALQVQHSDGDLNLELTVKSYELKDEHNAKTHVFTMQDKLMPVTVKVFYKAYKKVDIIETWTEISHREKGSIFLKRFDSGSLTLRRGDVWITHLHGDWCAEAQLTQEPLTRGLKVIRNTDGARNAHCDAPEIMLSLDGEPREDEGRTIGAALCWSGNYEIRVNTNNSKTHQLYAGIDPQSSEYVLEAGRIFATPHLALTYSNKGMGEVSRNFHRWARTEGMLHRGMKTGDILLNSWEGIYFDITEQKIIDMMDDIAKFGGELFVMDDGWFGDKYQRNDDSSTLGDWVTDLKKLPGGIKALTDAARQRKIKFGIWIEPEAVNTKSELFEQHPEWALQTKGRELKLGRGGTQLVLDMTNPKVQDFAFKIVDDLLTQYPEISYIKWDANASIQNYGSLYLPKNKQNNLYIDYHLGLLKVLERIRQKYPDVVIQDCASGGGRANYGLLPYFDEFWVSDNTDALQRVYIQWGTSLFFPANAMAQHIGGVPYWNTGGRITPIKFRCDVAMSGRLGIELQPKHMNEEEKLQCTTCFADYKELRQTIQTGDLYRLQNPYNRKGIASLMYVNENKSQAVVFVYKVDNYYSMPIPRIRLKGLDPDATYTVIEKDVKAWQKPCDLSGRKFTGRFLMEVGLEIPLDWDYASRVFELKLGVGLARQLNERLNSLQKRGYMVGHQDDPFYGMDWNGDLGRSDTKDAVGDYPAVMGFELGGIEMDDEKNLDSVPFSRIRQEIIAHAERGGIVTVSWHPRNPYTGGTAWDNADNVVVKSILPGGEQHLKFMSWMQKVSRFMKTLKTKNGQSVPIIFRPWHENNGDWFWWGDKQCTLEEFHALWCMLQDYLRSEGFENLLWSWSPNLGVDPTDLNYYPGNDRVDLIGLDAYQWGAEADYVCQLNADFELLTSFAQKHGKLLALTECGLQNLPDPTWWTRVLKPVLDKYPIVYFLPWRNNGHKEYYGPAPGQENTRYFKEMISDPRVLMLQDIIK